MTKHNLKLNDRYFDAVLNGIKTFEIRKDDRGFRVGDTLEMYRVNDNGLYVSKDGTYASNEKGAWLEPIQMKVTYIITHADFPAGIPEGYVVMSIEKVKE
ncbi:MAG: DUF3850 domain-containing protein [Clostridiales bacterium]|nr:DUF3850 domain-containing protein [Clostridiales bacterium]